MRLSEQKWVRVMADFSSDALWAKDGCGVDAGELPVSPETLARLATWQERYDNECEDYLPPEQRVKTFDQVSFAAEGRAIAEAIKRELPDWTVIYFDEARTGNTPRLDYEYEIKIGND